MILLFAWQLMTVLSFGLTASTLKRDTVFWLFRTGQTDNGKVEKLSHFRARLSVTVICMAACTVSL